MQEVKNTWTTVMLIYHGMVRCEQPRWCASGVVVFVSQNLNPNATTYLKVWPTVKVDRWQLTVTSYIP